MASPAITGTVRRRVPAGWAESAAGLVALIAVWQFFATVVFTGRHVVPAPSQVAAAAFDARFYWPNLQVTLWEAVRGWLAGNIAAVALAVAALFVPRLSRPFQQFGAITYCVPTVAVGPLLLIVTDPDTTKVLIAALSVFFTSLIAWMTGLRACDQSSLDLVRAFGGGRISELVRVRLRAALPSAAGGLALSAPAAFLGAIIGEYLGGVSGLGVAMVSAEENFQVPQTWAIGLIATAVSGLSYGVVLLAAKSLAHGPRTGTWAAAVAPAMTRNGRGRLLFRLASPLAALAAMVAAWAVSIKLAGLSSYFAKSPSDVWSFLVSGSGAAANRGTVFGALWTTVRDAGGGWAAGTIAALAGAALLVQVPRLRSVVMPMVMVLRSVPLIAMTPLIALVFGQGTAGVTVIAGIVTFVPTLVLVTSGLATAPPEAIDLARAYNLSGLRVLLSVRARYATPSLFAAAKVAIPGSILGAVLAEWLLTGGGIGHLMAVSLIGSDFGTLWASVVVVSGVSLLLYEIAVAAETAAERRLAS